MRNAGVGRPFGTAVRCALAAAAVGFFAVNLNSEPLEAAQAVKQSPHDVLNQVLGVTESNVVTLEVDTTPGQPVFVGVPIRGALALLDLAPNSVRASGYRLIVQNEDGSYTDVEPGLERTLKGEVVGDPFSRVAGSMLEAGLVARISFSNGEEYWIEPVRKRAPGFGPMDHVIYNAEDVIGDCGSCAADAAEMLVSPELVNNDGGAVTGGTIKVAELACDADVEYFNDYGSVNAVENRINNVINTVNQQYETEVEITHEITAIIVRTSEPDPYSTTDPVDLLVQFRNHWQSQQGGIQRDLAQLFTGKNLQGGTIGIAWLGSVCTSFAYSLVESDFNGVFSCATDLSAHEMGHSWGADHCSCNNFTMNPFITCANTFHNTFTEPDIISFRNSVDFCLDDQGSNDEELVDFFTFIAWTGSVVGGNLNSVLQSDNDRLRVASEFAWGAWHITSTVYKGTSPFGSASEMNLTFEVSADIEQGVRASLWDYNAGTWVTIVSIVASPTDQTVTVSANNPNRFIQNSDGEVKVRVRSTTMESEHEIRVDHLAVEVVD